MIENTLMRIILVEDDTDLRESLIDCLELQGYLLTGVANALSFYQTISADIFDLAIIDIGLPDQSGFEIVSHVKENNSMGIVVLTAMGDPEFRIRGYESGADLYLVKPVGCQELAAAIANLSVRLNNYTDAQHFPRSSAWVLNIIGLHLVTPTGIIIALTVREAIFLNCLMSHPGQDITRLMVCKALGFNHENSKDRRMDSMVRRLRKKIDETSGLNLPIQTIYGKGYIFSHQATVL